MIGGICLSVRLSVCPVLRLNSKRKGPGSPKLAGWKPWTYLEVKRSKVKVNRSINAVTDDAPYTQVGVITIFLKLACYTSENTACITTLRAYENRFCLLRPLKQRFAADSTRTKRSPVRKRTPFDLQAARLAVVRSDMSQPGQHGDDGVMLADISCGGCGIIGWWKGTAKLELGCWIGHEFRQYVIIMLNGICEQAAGLETRRCDVHGGRGAENARLQMKD